MKGQLPNDQQAIRLLQAAYNIGRWEAAKIHYSDGADWWTQGGNMRDPKEAPSKQAKDFCSYGERKDNGTD